MWRTGKVRRRKNDHPRSWITPPGAVDHAAVDIDIQACDNGQLTVSPVFGPGSSYTQTTAPA